VKKFLILFSLVFLAASLVGAQDLEEAPSICDASDACKKACQEKEAEGHDDYDSKHQQLLLKCAGDVAKNLKLIQ
jgi:hypothetical protein